MNILENTSSYSALLHTICCLLLSFIYVFSDNMFILGMLLISLFYSICFWSLFTYTKNKKTECNFYHYDTTSWAEFKHDLSILILLNGMGVVTSFLVTDLIDILQAGQENLLFLLVAGCSLTITLISYIRFTVKEISHILDTIKIVNDTQQKLASLKHYHFNFSNLDNFTFIAKRFQHGKFSINALKINNIYVDFETNKVYLPQKSNTATLTSYLKMSDKNLDELDTDDCIIIEMLT